VSHRLRAFAPTGVTLVVLALAVLSSRRITIENDIGKLLPDSDARFVQTTQALRSFLERTLIDVGSSDGSHSVEFLGEVADRVSAKLLASGLARRARARLAMGDALELVEFVRAHAPLLLPDSAWPEIEPRLAPAEVATAVQTLARRIQEPDGAFLAELAARDPLGILSLALAPLGAFAAGPPGAELVDGRIVSTDRRHVLMVVEPGFAPGEYERTTSYLETLTRLEHEIESDPATRGVELSWVGAHRSARDNEQQIRRDVGVTSLVSGLLIAALTYLFLGSVRVVLASLAPAAVGGLLALGVFALFRPTIAGPILGFGTVLIGLTIDYAVHVLTSMQKRSGPLPTRALLMGALTTILAFTLLHGSALPGIRDMGTFGILGIVAAVVFSLWVLPSWAPLLGEPRPPRIDLEHLMRRAPRRSSWVALALTPLLAWGVRSIAFDGDVRRLSHLSPAAAADEERVRAVWGSSQTSTLTVSAASLEDALRANDEAEQTLENATREGRLVGHASLSGVLPSRRTQEERAERWRSFWTSERRLELAKNLETAGAAAGFRAQAFAPFLATLEETPDWLELSELRAGPAADLVADRIAEDAGGWHVHTPVFTRDWEQYTRLEEHLSAAQPAAVLANREALMRRVSELVQNEMVVLGSLAFLGVALIVAVWLADLLLTGVVLVPLLLALLWTLGILGWLGEPLNLVNAVFVVFQFGVAIDYAIFVSSAHLERLREGLDRTAEARGSVLLCSVTTCLGFGALALAGHPVLYTIGVTASIGIACAGAAVLLFVPPLCEVAFARAARRAVAPGVDWRRALALRYRYHGPFVQHYAASKAKRDPLVEALAALCTGTGPVLVVGCGYGVMTTRLAGAQPTRAFVALEPDERKLKTARRVLGEGSSVRFRAEDVRAHASSEAYEWCLLVDVLHYWDEPGQRAILAKVRELLRPDGKLLFRDGLSDAGRKNWLVHGGESLARLSGFTRMNERLYFHDEKTWQRLLSESGFQIEAAHEELGLFSNQVWIASRAE
jgi:predicted exporter/SAM-dependent methyltransferase